MDPVCRHQTLSPSEFGVGNKIQNPFDTDNSKDWRGRETDIRAQFSNAESRIRRVSAKIVMTGAPTVAVLGIEAGVGMLPWGEWSTGAKHSGNNDLTMLHIYDGKGNTFYEGNWVNSEHVPLGRNYCADLSEYNNQVGYRNSPLMHHLDNSLARFECPGRWTYSCDIRTGCPVGWYDCICDPPLVNDGNDNCILDCEPGYQYDYYLQDCIDLCPDTDWNSNTQQCCPEGAPLFSTAEGECYDECQYDAYWDWGANGPPGQCVDWCPPCKDPVWEDVCPSKGGPCTTVLNCVYQCEANEICSTQGAVNFDKCIKQDKGGPIDIDPGGSNCPGLGDLNGEAGVTLQDIQCHVLTVLYVIELAGQVSGGGIQKALTMPACLTGGLGTADVNCDGVVAVNDILITVGLSLDLGVPAQLDTDSDSCPDACVP